MDELHYSRGQGLKRPRVHSLVLLVLAWGIQAIVTQSLLLREALVLMSGSEFAWGVVLFAWLLGVAIGAAAGGRAAGRLARGDFALVGVLLLLTAVTCADLWVFRGARAWLGVQPGELLPLATAALSAMLFVSPAGALVGLAFPLACRIVESDCGLRTADYGLPSPQSSVLSPSSPGVGPLGWVYAIESLGSLIGGAVFSFWAVEHLAPIQTALLCGALTATASAALLRVSLFPLLIAVACATVTVTSGNALDRRLVDRRWRTIAPGYELCAQAESKYQNLAVGRRAEQYTLYCDGQVSADFPDPYTFVPLAHFWMCQHPAPRNVLLLGGGAEGLLSEVLRHPVDRVDYVEPDPRQIEIITPYLAKPDRAALADPRVTVHHVDARHFVKTQRGQFDLVIARLPEPTSALRARFYTDEFFRELRRAMTPKSVLCMTVAAAPGELSKASAEYLASVRATIRRHLPHVVVGWDDPAHVLAATAPGLVSTDPAELTRRYAERGVQSPLFHPAWFEGATDWLDPDKLRRRADELDAVVDAQISTDLRPLIYVQRLVLWDRMTGGASAGVIERLRSISLPWLTGGLGCTGVLTLLLCYRRRGRPREWLSTGAVVLSVATTGFVTMALSIVWLYAFQSLYGYVYQRIGWIIAIFMGGLVAGCGLTARRSARHKEPARLSAYLWQRLILVDGLLAGLALLAPLLLPLLGRLQETRPTLTAVEWLVSALVALTGLLGGTAFALAGGLQLAVTREAGAAAGSVVGADHAGACLGALATGILLVPVYGTATAAFLLAGMKLASAALLLGGRRYAGGS